MIPAEAVEVDNKPGMVTMPNSLDRLAWMMANPSEYFLFARHLSEQFTYYSHHGKRKPMHRAGTEYWKDRRNG